MPASHERIPNRSLSGTELVQIIERDVHNILTRDGMFTNNIAFARVSYEVRVSVHLDNPIYPEHIAIVLSRPQSKQEIEKDPQLAAIEPSPLVEPLTEQETVFSEEMHREIASPNMARIEHEIPLIIEKRNLDTNMIERKEQKFVGDIPDPATVGNITSDKSTGDDQRQQWKTKKKVKK